MDDSIRIRAAASREDLDTCVRLQREVWGLSDLEVTSPIQLTATLHAGGLLHLAETADGQAAGFTYAFPAIRGGVAHLHSDMLAVVPAHQARGLGGRLKWAQREDALKAGVSLITWTYDPMQARNANLNLHRLGATAMEFLPNFYGVTSSSLHHRLPTDRLLVYWNLRSPRVLALAEKREENRTVPRPDLPSINEVKWQAGWPVSSEPALDRAEGELLLEIVPDWDVLARAAPRVAEGWQSRIKTAFQSYLGRGYVGADFAMTEERGRRRPFYVLR
jgi:predicted GNAT superfamily acetyltransferase